MATTTTLPTEIITEILIRLPIKSLTRFLSVSKSWFSLIQNPNFINLHLNQTLISNSDKYLILNRHNSIYISDFNLDNIRNPLSFSELHYPPRPTGGQVIGSCNGVICISDFSMTYVALLNPVTKEFRVIHPTRIRDFETECLDPVYYGFGYDSVTDDYKVFYYFRNFKNSEVYLEVFSFKSNSWKRVENVCEFGSFFNSYGFYFNEAMYYVAYKRCESNLRRKFIVKFDFRTDTLLPMECPNSDDKFNESLLYSFSELDGCLCLLVSYFPENSYTDAMIGLGPLVRADLWMMKGCGENEGWVRLFSIGDPRNIGIERDISAVGFKDGNGSRILLEVDGFKIGWYDVDNGSFETIVTCGLPESWYNSGMYYLSGSLVALQSEGRRFMTKKEEEEGEVEEV